MTGRELPPELLDLIAFCLPSMEHVEVLLLLRADPERAWTSDEVAGQLKIDRRSSARCLEELHRNALLGAVGDPTVYRFAPRSEPLARASALLLDAYQRTPVLLVKALYQRPAPGLRTFSDAFRL